MAASTRASSTLRHEASIEATSLWLSGDHESCIQTLQRLELDHTLDEDCHLQVQHNLAVVDHYSNKRRNPSRLLDQLTLLIREAANKTCESSAPQATSRGGHAAITAAAVQEAVSVTAAEEDVAILKLNKALLLYRALNYHEATQLLSPLLQHIDGLDEGAALHILLLLLDMHLHQHNIQQAAHVLDIFDKASPSLASSFAAASLQQRQCAAAVEGAAPLPASSAELSPGSASPELQLASENSAARRLPAPTGVSHTLPFVSNWGSGAMIAACHLLTQRGHPVPAPPNIPLLLKLYRIRLALLQQNIRAAKRELRALSSLECVPPAAAPSVGPGQGPSAEAGPAQGGSAGSASGAAPSSDPAALLEAAQSTSTAVACGTASTAPVSKPEPSELSGSDPSTAAAAARSGAEEASGAGQGLLNVARASALARAHVEVLRGCRRKAAHALLGLLQGAGSSSVPDAPAAAPSSDAGASCTSSSSMRPALLNDLGVVHHVGRSHQLSALHFKQALSELAAHGDGGADAGGNDSGASCGGGTEGEGGVSYQQYAMEYNAGLQYAALGRHEAALSRFAHCLSVSQHASGIAAHRPLLLLRAAQAALGLHSILQHNTHAASPLAASAAREGGASASQPASTLPCDPPAPAPHSLLRHSKDRSQALLQQALLWLQAACEPMESPQQQQQQQRQPTVRPAGMTSSVAQQQQQLGPEDGHLPAGASDAKEHDHTAVLPAILTHLAYVHLLLGDHDAALASSMQLLGTPNADPSQVQVAACYAAEVLRALGREREAVEVMLQAQAVWAAAGAADGAGLGSSAGARVPEEDSPGDTAAASAPAGEGSGGAAAGATPAGSRRAEADRAGRAALCTNLAAMLVDQSATTEARESAGPDAAASSGPSPALLAAEALELQPRCRQASLLATYLDMTSGRCNDALDRMREMQL